LIDARQFAFLGGLANILRNLSSDKWYKAGCNQKLYWVIGMDELLSIIEVEGNLESADQDLKNCLALVGIEKEKLKRLFSLKKNQFKKEEV